MTCHDTTVLLYEVLTFLELRPEDDYVKYYCTLIVQTTATPRAPLYEYSTVV